MADNITTDFIREIEKEVDKQTEYSAPNIWLESQTQQGKNRIVEMIANMAIDNDRTPSECIMDLEMVLNCE